MKNKKDILLLIPILLIVASIILNNYLGDLDEVWNYNFARNILEGRLPYKDFNMLQMPLLPIINSLFLFILGNELIVMRILAILMCTAIFFLIYQILKKLKIDFNISIVILMSIIYLFKDHLRIDYNFATIFIVLFIIYKEIKYNNEILKLNFKNDILIGILAGTSILFKQTSGIILCIATLGYKLLLIKNKEELREYIKIFTIRFLGILIPVFIFIIYVSVLGIWNDFIDYTILGVKTFSNSIPYTNLLKEGKFIIKILAVLLPINIIFQFIFSNIIYRKKRKGVNFFILSSYSISTAVIVFPIADEIHFLLAMIPGIILFYYFIYQILLKVLNKKQQLFIKYFMQVVSIWLILTLVLVSIYTLTKYIYNVENYNILEHFKYIPVSQSLENQIDIVDYYIENSDNEVLILDATAGVYMIPINKYHKDYDMFLKGNLGSKSEDGIIANLEKIENVTLLIINDKTSRNWQNPEKVRNYIKSNWNKTGEIACFDIYEK